jgi:ABC-2 type transport system ATP-binding protein
MAQTADHLIVIGRGRIIADAPVKDIIAGTRQAKTLVRTGDAPFLQSLLAGNGVTVDQSEPETLTVTGLDPRQIAQVALDNEVLVYELTPQLSSLEDAYFDLTKDEVEYHSHLTGGPAGAQPAAAPATAGK